MYTVKFDIENYLAEYLRGKWGPTIVEIPRDVYLYNLLHSLTKKQPSHVPVLSGNVEIIIPCRREGNKNPEYYNYVSSGGAELFNKALKLFFRADLHEFVDHMKHDKGYTYKDACFLFASQYGIESIDTESLIKNYYRWKEKVRKKAYVTA